MALELQLNTAKAEQALRRIEASLSSLQAALNRTSTGSGFDAFLTKLQGFSGVPSQAVGSLTALGNAANAMGGAANNINNMARALQRLGAMDVTKVAVGMNALVRQLDQLHAPASLANLITQVGALGRASATATTEVHKLNMALNGVKVPAGLTGLPPVAQQGAAQVKSLRDRFNELSQSSNQASSFIKGFGVSLAGLGMAKFLRDSFELNNSLDKFNALITNLNGADEAGKSLDFVRAVARETATDVRALIDSYGTWTTSAQMSGKTAAESGEMFRKLNVVFRSLGLGAEDTKGAMKAFTQMVQKGKISMEELRSQLGDRGVPAVNSLARALGVSVFEIDRMAQASELGADKVGLLIDQLEKDFGGSLPIMLKTFGAQWQQLMNNITELQLAFNKPFFDTFAAGLAQLNTVLATPYVRQLAADLGTLLGVLATVAAYMTSGIIVTMTLVVEIVRTLTAGILLLTGTIAGSFIAGLQGIVMFLGMVGQAFNDWFIQPILQAIDYVFRITEVLTWLGQAFDAYIIQPMMQIPGMVELVNAFREAWEWLMIPLKAVGELVAWLWDKLKRLMETIGRVLEFNNMLGESFDSSAWKLKTFGENTEKVNKSASELARTMTGAASETGNFSSQVENGSNKLDRLNSISRQASYTFDDYADSARSAASAQEELNAAAAAYRPPSSGGSGSSAPSGGGSTSYGDGFEGFDFGSGSSGFALGGDDLSGKVFLSEWNGTGGFGSGYGSGPAGSSLGSFGGFGGGSAGASTGGGFGGFGSTTTERSGVGFGAFAGGGISHAPTRFTKAPLSAFANAPHFQYGGTTQGMGGSLPGGGIPSVLHPNEAVVPLTGGGSIPVSGGSVVVPGFQKVADTLVEVKRVADVHTSLLASIEECVKESNYTLIDSFNRLSEQFSVSFGTLNATIVAMSDRLATATRSGGGSAPSLGSPTGSTLSGGGDARVMPDLFDTGGSGAATFEELRKRLAAGDNSAIGGQYSGMIRLANEKKLTRAGFGFASGSPNASKDARGGFQATLHPDEAVIPLPDGRSVPVDLTNWNPEKFDPPMLRSTLDEGPRHMVNSEGGSGRGPTSVVVNMEVKTPDAESFRKSKAQMLQELRANMDRAVQKVGLSHVDDDPTRRV